MSNKKVICGGIYKSHHYWNDGARFIVTAAGFIVTAAGLNSVLIADYPMIKFNESYMEYCVSRKEFESKFEFVEETK